MTDPKLRLRILNTIDDLVANLLYYDRKEDENLPRGAIEQAVEHGVITVDEMIEKFADGLRGNLPGESR